MPFAPSRAGNRASLVPPTLAGAMRRRLGAQEQAIFGMLLAGIDPPEIATTLGISERALDTRRWAMLQKLEGLRTGAAGATSSRAPLFRGRIRRRPTPGC